MSPSSLKNTPLQKCTISENEGTHLRALSFSYSMGEKNICAERAKRLGNANEIYAEGAETLEHRCEIDAEGAVTLNKLYTIGAEGAKTLVYFRVHVF